MTAGTFLVALTLVVLVLLLWNLRWVLLVLLGRASPQCCVVSALAPYLL